MARHCQWICSPSCAGGQKRYLQRRPDEYHEKIVNNKGNGKNMTALADAIVHKDAAKLLGLVGVDNLRALIKNSS